MESSYANAVAYARETFAPQSAQELIDWAWGLGRFGKTPLVVASYRAALSCKEICRVGVPADAYWNGRHGQVDVAGALDLIRQWLEEPEAGHASRAKTFALGLSAIVESMFTDEEDLSGATDLVQARRRHLWAVTSVLLALQATAWTEESVPLDLDHAERAARLASGPSHEAAQSLVMAARATANLGLVFAAARDALVG